MNGIIVINKPSGFTSFDIVAVMRGIAKTRKAGHTGTLDPMATGVLPILLGNATKAQSLIPDSSKEYIADFRLGITTDTLDITGKIIEEKNSYVSQMELENILPEFTGNIFQIPPMYSAVQKDGKRLYELARQGIEVEREKREITIYKLELLEYDEKAQAGRLLTGCSGGTYIRTLIDDIGKRLGCGGVMTALCRSSACGYSLSDAATLEEVRKISAEGKLESILRSVDGLFSIYREVRVSDAQVKRFCSGGQLDLSRLKIDNLSDREIVRVKSVSGYFIGLGIAEKEKGWLAIHKLFSGYDEYEKDKGGSN